MRTTRSILNDLYKTLSAQYEDQLNDFGKMLMPKTKEALLDGFKDGLRTASIKPSQLLGVEVKE